MITCRICGELFQTLSSHIYFKHKISKSEYLEKFPDADWVSKKLSEQISQNLKERHKHEKETDYEKYIATRNRVCTEMRERKGENWNHSEKTKKQMSLSHTGKKRKPHSYKTRQKISEARKGTKVVLSPETKIKKSARQQEAWEKRKQNTVQYAEYVEKLSQHRKKYIKENGHHFCQKNETSIEMLCIDFLINNDIKYDFQYYLDGKRYDFFLPEFNLLIEVDGEYWHTLEPSIKNDIEKHYLSKKHNLRLLRISSDDLNFSIILESPDKQDIHTNQILKNRGINLNEF
jgi:very-short-patch-repair endonuclease